MDQNMHRSRLRGQPYPIFLEALHVSVPRGKDAHSSLTSADICLVAGRCSCTVATRTDQRHRHHVPAALPVALSLSRSLSFSFLLFLSPRRIRAFRYPRGILPAIRAQRSTTNATYALSSCPSCSLVVSLLAHCTHATSLPLYRTRVNRTYWKLRVMRYTHMSVRCCGYTKRSAKKVSATLCANRIHV